MAGRDCPPASGKKCHGPCLYPVIIGRCPVFCPLTGIIHWTEQAMSERVFASGWQGPPCPAVQGPTGRCSEDDETQDIDTGAGNVQLGNRQATGTQVQQDGVQSPNVAQ